MSFDEFLSRLPGGRWIGSVTTFLLFGGLFHWVDLMEKIPNWSLWLLKAIVAGDSADALQVQPTTLGRVLVLAIYFSLAAIVSLAIFFHATWRGKMEARFARKHGGLLIKQAGEVYRWLSSRTDLPYIESQVRRELVIKRNYDVEFTDRSTLRGEASAALYAIAWELVSDERLQDNDQCEIGVKSLTPGVTALCVLAEQTLGRTRHIILIVPPLPPDHPGATLEVKARWPKAARKLEKLSVPDIMTYRVKKRIRSPIDEVVFSVTVEPEGEFSFEHEVDAGDCETCEPTSSSTRHYHLRATNLQPKGEIAVRVLRTAKAVAKGGG